MHPQIAKLLILQEIDRELLKLGKELAQYPARRQTRLAEVERAEQALARADETIRDCEVRLRETEGEADAIRETVKKFQVQLNTVKSQKEYEAITQEIEQAGEKSAALDETGLELLERQEALQVEREALARSLEAKRRETEVEIGRLEQREAEKTEALEAGRRRREEAAAGVEPELLHRYERLSEQHPGSAVAPLNGRNCGGCHLTLLPRLVAELEKDAEICECSSCHRFLYVPA